MNRNEALETYVMLTKLMISMNSPLASRHNTTFTTPQLYTLVYLDECGPMNLTKIAQHIQVSNQAMTGISNKLVGDGYIERIYLPENRRQIIVRLTPKGENYMKEFYQTMDGVFAQIFTDCTDEEIIELGKASRKIIGTLMKVNGDFGQDYQNKVAKVMNGEI